MLSGSLEAWVFTWLLLVMSYVKWQYKVDLVSSVNQFIFSSWGKKKKQSSKTAVTVIYDFDNIPVIYVFFFKEVKYWSFSLLIEILLYFCIKITCASTIPFNSLDIERKGTDVMIRSWPAFAPLLQICWVLIYRKWNTEVSLKRGVEYISIFKDEDIQYLNSVLVGISHLLGVKWL